MKKKFLLLLIIIAAIGAVVYLPSGKTTSTPAYAASEEVVARDVTISGRPAGEVLVGNQVVIRLRTSAGGSTPYQRAQEVTRRLQNVIGTASGRSFVTKRIGGQEVVMAGQTIIITADPAEASLNGMTATGLANSWALRLSTALGVSAQDNTPVGQKIVPIISLGSGLRVGGALVSGASDRLSDVVAVAQVEGSLGNEVRVRVLVPVSTTNIVSNIKRVPETAVIGLVDIKL